MLPSVVATELERAIQRFLRSAFPITTGYFQRGRDGGGPQALIDDLVTRPGALFQGPFLDIKLPFRVARDAPLPFRHLLVPFAPYQHQMRAFQRLAGDAPRSTLIATGTGSGKTECFMYPLLDDCLHRRERGIKAIVIYPMNALAADQARRFAREVAKFDTRLSVGLFVGGEQTDADTAMGPDNVITSHKTLRQHPPDILLTNYKMLDFLLIRPKDQPLWRFNEPGRWRYLVVDELHTFDGAQGTDLACLIRRLRDRLDAGPELACVGTSATLGTDAAGDLMTYASEVFAASFDGASVIGEDRLHPDEYLRADEGHKAGTMADLQWADGAAGALDPSGYQSTEAYVQAQLRLWFAEWPAQALPVLDAGSAQQRALAAVELGRMLHQHPAFHALIHATRRLIDLHQLAADWQQKLNLANASSAMRLLVSLVALVSTARLWRDEDRGQTQPFLEVREQLWLRELRRLVCTVPAEKGELPGLRFADDLHNPLKPLHLPLLHCRNCHLAAWGAVQKHGDSHLEGDLQTFYREWFGYSTQARLLVPHLDVTPVNDDERRAMQCLCPHCLLLQGQGEAGECRECGQDGLVRVRVPDMVRETRKGGDTHPVGHHDCPACGARESMAIVGYRAATLTSVMTGRLFTTPYNDDFKLIAFSDSVQDAAHRAGFLGGNTWRQVVRQAMAGWLRGQTGPVSLRDMKAQLPAAWRQSAGSAERFCGVFIAPDMAWLRDYDALTQTGVLPTGSDLTDMVGKRLAWECVAEFGVRGTVGRSLERMGVAAVGVDATRLIEDAHKLALRLREEIGSLRDMDPDVFVRFVVGWLHHMRQGGAIYDPVLDGYLTNKGKEYLLNARIRWMPNFGRSRRPPAAITLGHVTRNFEPLVLAQRDTWSMRWLKKTLGHEAVFAAAEARQIFQLCLRGLARAGWLVEREASGESLYLLDPERLLIGSQCLRMACAQCGNQLLLEASSRELYQGMTCLRPQCMGQLDVMAGNDAPLLDYAATQPRRLVPHEHTGLLPRETRERVEHSFITGTEPWDINLLSATPTLEMGIDIGELSSVFLCSVPPTQANYLQRIGRAGRRDGNALAVTVANGRSHDLYFNAAPMEMMAGQVHTPGVFLQATAVLERQLIAYCFDRWVASGINEAAIPGRMGKVIDAVEGQHQDHFPYTFLSFIRQHHDAIAAGFFACFDSLRDEAKAHLQAFIRDQGEASLGWRLTHRLLELVDERKSLKKKAQQLKTEQERLKKPPVDEHTQALLKAVTDERIALLSLLSGLNKHLVLNFFTDEGLLPNYAFPEAGVTLQSVILRRLSDGQRDAHGSRYEKLAYTFQRPAQAALSELAPESRFYAASHKLPIDKIDLETSKEETWRFCDSCQYTEHVEPADRHSACPRCGSAQWADNGQKHTVLKLRQVYSTVSDRDSRISDDSEQREPTFFQRQMLVDADPAQNSGGFRIKSDVLPFGFEFLKRVTLREVNFGVRGGQAKNFKVAGAERPRPGFRICRHCGKVQKSYWRASERRHDFTCKLSKHPEQEKPDDYFDSLYLYRELNSEAIRILLPLSEVAYSDEKLHSFVAALNLGLKHYFRGDVHHLQVAEMREPDRGGSGERIYLVIYDRIPGGTGYLKELMRDSDHIKRVLEGALDRLNTCRCIDDEHRDGCYRCILAYRDSRNMASISRRAAVELLKDIVDQWCELEPVHKLSDINTSALTESALEQKFIDALAHLSGARMAPTLVHGKPGYLLSLPGAQGAPVIWKVEQQVAVGPADGVARQTRIDAVLWPARAGDETRYKPIAIYMDGLQYHHNIVADDVEKRMALLRSGWFWVYSFNWDDLPEPGKPLRMPEHDLMRADGPAQGMISIFDKLAAKAGWSRAVEQGARNGWSALEWLEQLLRDPELAQTGYMQRAAFRGLTALAPLAAKNPVVRGAMQQELAELAPNVVVEAFGLDQAGQLPGGFMTALGNPAPGVAMSVALPASTIQSGQAQELANALQLHLCFDDRDTEPTDAFKAAWRTFWFAANQLQFLLGFSLATRTAVASGALERLWADAKAVQACSDAPADESWAEVFELSTLPAEQLRALQGLEMPEPDVGCDLVADDGAVVIGGNEVELSWPAQRVAVLLTDELPELFDWRFVAAGPDLVPKLQVLMEEGVL